MLLLNTVQWQTYMQLNTYENYTLHTDTYKIFPLTNITKVTLGRRGKDVCLYIWWVYVLACISVHV